ncbi:MAG: hypothetical protein IKK84_00015 [Clostridia bacterium]|nr:hypothetical protein [Clostridia bacterium]
MQIVLFIMLMACLIIITLMGGMMWLFWREYTATQEQSAKDFVKLVEVIDKNYKVQENIFNSLVK